MRSQKDIDQVRKLVGDLISKTQAKETEARVQEALKDLRQLTLQPSTELDVISAKLDAVADSISRLQSNMETTRSNQDTLRALCFEGFDSRQHNILDAHSKTFEWAFSDEAEGVHGTIPLYFKDWLQNHNGTYWIRGKAGSGKSTLMKFLYNDKRTESALQTWAGVDRKLVMAKYFIYNLGQPLQKSQEGLMRSLLFDILCHCPEHIPKVRDILNRGHGHIWNGKETWTLKTLWQLLKAIIAETAATKICLFLDGLDEIDGEVESLIDTVKALAGLSIKVCVSSRPWAEFIHEFGTDSKRVLKVEDLTAGDIRSYVYQTLTSNSRFRTLAAKDSMLSQLQDEIVSKSAGVFLWVRLVVRSLLQAPTYADTPSLLWRRFRSIPPDLDKYFLQIIQSIPYIYRAKGAGIFKTAMSCPSMPAMVHYFIDCDEEDENFALDCPLQAMQPDETAENIQEMVLKLDGWTKGLLEVVNYAPGPNYECTRVEFLHRTVRDFLEESGHARQLLDNLQTPQKDVSEKICLGSLAFLKRHPKNEEDSRGVILGFIFSHAAFAVNDERKRIHHILNLCGNAMVEDGRDWRGTAETSGMLFYAVKYGLKEYIQETLQNWDYTESSVAPFHAGTCRTFLSWPESVNHLGAAQTK
ncbi:hypothetical protein K4F52_004153 [Lecanicillium sp. MT-2017a]|nr:hypothetical protein K4F52_004153 [Lecanicillium sp. MT-2017a]